jgi:hypothetical protein
LSPPIGFRYTKHRVIHADVFTYRDSSSMMELMVTTDKCAPITEVYAEKGRGIDVMQYIDFVHHMPHESVFDPPSLCQPAATPYAKMAEMVRCLL